MSKSPKILENGKINQEQREEIVDMALQNLKTIMADYETPIETRLKVALDVFENFTTEPSKARKNHRS
jgi:polyhydroxyalkanoate synthesis regulator phasin